MTQGRTAHISPGWWKPWEQHKCDTVLLFSDWAAQY